VKLYTYTMERSLPKLALKGLPREFPLFGSAVPAAEMAEMESGGKERAVVLEVDVDGLDDVIVVSGERVEDVAVMASESIDFSEGENPEDEAKAQAAYDEVYKDAHNLSSIQDMLDKFEMVMNQEEIGSSRITVLGVPDLEYSEDIGGDPKVTYDRPRQALKIYKQALVTRLLRSIFLPQHKLYGSGKRGPAMGFISRFIPRADPTEEVAPPPDVVSGVPLVWAAGKNFLRGMRGAFGEEAGDAIAKMVEMRAGGKPSKLLGSGAKGAAYTLPGGRVLKVTMDGNEVSAAANLIGARHPNLSFVHDAFIVSDGEKGSGFIVRDAVDTTLDRFSLKAAEELDWIMDEVLESSARKVGPDVVGMKDIDPAVLADEVTEAITKLRDTGCDTDEAILIDLADAFRELKYLGILGIDFDSKNVGVIKKPSPRVVLFDYGMTQSPPVEVPVISLQEARL